LSSSSPFPDRAVEAVGACTRALSGLEYADAALAQSDAATLSGLRAFGDRLALRARFHDPAIHNRHQPTEPSSAHLFEALEQARLDAIGARWLTGIANNLLAHPGAEPDGLRWLAFESFSGLSAPKDQAAAAGPLRRRLASSLIERLTGLAAHLKDQGRFARAAALWIRDAAPHIPREDASSASPLPFELRRKLNVRALPRRGDPGATVAPLKKRHEGSDDSEGSTGSGAITQGGTMATHYRAYNTAYDRVVNAASLVDRAELAELHLKLEAELGAIRPVVARLAKRLLRVLMARQTRHWRFDLDEGVIDGSRLAALVSSRGTARPFKEESESPFPSTVVTLLIDHSGSMRGRPMLIAALTVEVFARVLERCGVRCEILGFTTRDWDGGTPAREWAESGYPPNPGRLNSLQHIMIKSADVPWRRARIALGLFLHDEMLKENIDGEALDWAHGRLLARSERRKILVVVSDGTPMDEATLAANGYEYLESHLQHIVTGIETRSPVQLAAIGIGHDVSLFYGNATTIARIDHLGPALSAKLTTLLGERNRERRTKNSSLRRPGPPFVPVTTGA
jgi:cobaltochelatase CobT